MVARTEPTLWLALVAFLGAAIAGVLGILFWRRRDQAGARWLGIQMGATTLWLVGFGLELASPTVGAALLWFRVEIIGLAWIPVTWYAFVAEYTDAENPMAARTIVLLSLLPLANVPMILTNGAVHTLSWTAPQLVESGPFVLLSVEHGPVWWLNVGYSYLVISLAFVRLLRHRKRSVHRYRRQTDLVLLAAIPPGVLNGLYYAGVLPWPALDPTPFAFVFSGLVIFWALFRYDLLDLAPIARRSVVENMDDGMLVLSPDRRLIDANPAAQRLLADDDPIGSPIETSFPELDSLLGPLPDPTAGNTPLSGHAGSGGRRTLELGTDSLTLQRNGGQRVFDVKVTGLHDRNGAVTGWTVVLHDVTARKRREETLTGLQGTAQEMMRPETVDGVCEHVVTAARDVVDLEHVAIHLRRDDDTLQPVAYTDDVRELYETPPSFDIGEGLQGTAYERGETVVVDGDRPADAARDLDTSIESALVTPLGEYGVFGAGSTTRTSLDDETIHFAEVLAATATTAIARADREETVRERERELRQQNDRLEEFANVVSHDLRNPLTVASGHVEQIDDDAHADAIEQALGRMEEIIDDVLTLARQGEPVRNPDSVSLATVAEDAWELADTSGGALSVAADLQLLADESRLQQLLENLFRNSVDHGGADVSVSVGPVTGAPTGFYVADDGPGIPVEERDRIFESGVSTAQDGTGFGLAIVRQVVEDHGWAITATESESGGARFEITGVSRAAAEHVDGGASRSN
ncbi:histidine kinase N-terminal 7TM domain-containing protein [Halorientalis brevis]|uniref:histidine kinase n=1 Tax=Halorientalis brevis TaxID=1126241 RepID=A0ABD6C8P7_9EURY|nr:histidine kinase N-terminal 7TM domain-containing protein [Halorientalis brevis]